MEEKELSKLKIIEHPYLDSFVRNNDFKNKRFSRYLKRIETELFNFIRENTPLFNEKYKEKVSNLTEYLYVSLISLMNNLDKENKKYVTGLYLFNIDQMPQIVVNNKEKEMLERALAQDRLIYGLYNDVFEKIIIEYLSYKVATNENINEVNYIRETLPLCETDMLRLLNKIFTYFVIEFEHLAFFTKAYENHLNAGVRDLVEEYTAVKNKNEELNTELIKYKMILENFNEELKNTKAKNKQIMNEYTAELRNENYQLHKETEKLKKEIEKLKEINKENSSKIYEKIEDEEILQSNTSISDKNKINLNQLNLLFIISDDCTFLNELQTAFPNAKITFKNYEAIISKADYVVIFTSYINHPTYYGVKEICKQTNTKLIHCTNSNLEKIKETIFENI